jgi:hypothetical protein
MSNNLYSQVLPTSVEPVLGFKANDRVVFQINHEGQQIRPKSIRFNGVLQLWRNATFSTKIDATDKFFLDPDAGINGTIRQVTTRFGNSTVECINEFGRWCKIKSEATKYQIDNCTKTDSMLEALTYSNDAYVEGDDFKINVTQGMLFPLNAGASEIPFSIDLDIAPNTSVVPLPYSRTGQIEISIILQDNTKCGFLAKGGLQNTNYCYTMRNLELRYLAEPEAESAGSIILETKTNDHIPTILTKIAGIQFSPSHPFDAIVGCFLQQSHDSTASNMNYNYLQSEAINEQIEYMEFKVDGHDDILQYPLMKQTSEIMYNYLLAWHPYINAYDDVEVKRHGLTYTKLGLNPATNVSSVSCGYGIGVHLYGGVDAGSKVSFNISLKESPTVNKSYRCFFYAIGKLLI